MDKLLTVFFSLPTCLGPAHTGWNPHAWKLEIIIHSSENSARPTAVSGQILGVTLGPIIQTSSTD